jgi:poly(3-hydroxybutyrate) depolymerase
MEWSTASSFATSWRRWLQIEPTCGAFIERSLHMTVGCQDPYCERTYFLYLPCTNPKDGPLPLLFSIHCFGCTADTMKHWKQEADQYGFALVIPQGIQRAFNARVCCGEPLHANVDDKAFLNEIRNHLLAQPEHHLSAKAVYAVGWSNGGYMVVYAAELFRAVAPISGYQYDHFAVDHPVGLFLHHAADDPMVQATGCCTDPTMPKCCCGISEASPDTCLSASGFVEQFGVAMNGCSPDSWNEIIIRGVTCYTGSGCQRNTTYCVHPEGQHFNRPSVEIGFPMRGDIMDFFARDSCQISGSPWDADKLQCACPSPGMGRYCLGTAGSITEPNATTSAASKEWNSVIAPLILTFVLVAISVGVVHRHKANRKKYAGFQMAPTVELGSMEDKAVR